MTILLAGAESVVGAAGSLLGLENYTFLTGRLHSPESLFGGHSEGMIYRGFSNVPKNDRESSVCHAFGSQRLYPPAYPMLPPVRLSEIQLVELLKSGLGYYRPKETRVKREEG